MNNELRATLKQLRLHQLATRWDEYLELATKEKYSAARLLQFVIEQECGAKQENSRRLRRKRANIPEELEMETFPELIERLFKSLADHSQAKVLRRFASFDCLVIDEVGYVEVEPAQVGQFFTLMQRRHKSKTTLITSNLGFSQWDTFLRNPHLTAALIDRLTEDSHVVNMQGCKSLRAKLAEGAE